VERDCGAGEAVEDTPLGPDDDDRSAADTQGNVDGLAVELDAERTVGVTLGKKGGASGVTSASPSTLRVTFFLPTVRLPEVGVGEYGVLISLRI
jgi:hypothetical protein